MGCTLPDVAAIDRAHRNAVAAPKPRISRETLVAWVFISPWVIGFVVFLLGPLIASLVLSFYRWDLIGSPRFIGLENYRELFGDRLFKQALKVTSSYAVMRVPLGIASGLAVALLLNMNVKFQGFWRIVYYMPVVLPPVAVSLLWTWIYNPQYGIANGLLSEIGIEGPAWLQSTTWVLPSLMLMAVWGAMGKDMLIYLSGLQSVSPDLYGAATMDGAGAWNKFRHVTLPMLTPIIFFNLVTGLIDTFQLFTQAYVMTQGGPRNSSLFVYFYLFQNAFERFRMGYASAMGVTITVLILVLTLLVLKSSSVWVYYEGEVAGGTKKKDNDKKSKRFRKSASDSMKEAV